MRAPAVGWFTTKSTHTCASNLFKPAQLYNHLQASNAASQVSENKSYRSQPLSLVKIILSATTALGPTTDVMIRLSHHDRPNVYDLSRIRTKLSASRIQISSTIAVQLTLAYIPVSGEAREKKRPPGDATLIPSVPGEIGTIIAYLSRSFTTTTLLYDGSTSVLSTIATPTAASEVGTVIAYAPGFSRTSPRCMMARSQ